LPIFGSPQSRSPESKVGLCFDQAQGRRSAVHDIEGVFRRLLNSTANGLPSGCRKGHLGDETFPSVGIEPFGAITAHFAQDGGQRAPFIQYKLGGDAVTALLRQNAKRALTTLSKPFYIARSSAYLACFTACDKRSINSSNPAQVR
jgi:hypothetical protein